MNQKTRTMEVEVEVEELERRMKACQRKSEGCPVAWTMEMAECVIGMGGTLPSVELGELVVSHLCCFSNNNQPSLWKFLDQALSSGLLYPLHILSLLTSRIIPERRSQPEAYRLYLELLIRYAFSFDPPVGLHTSKDKILKSVDVALKLSQTYGFQDFNFGQAIVMYFFSIAIYLIDSLLDDWGLQIPSVGGAAETTTSVASHHIADINFGRNQFYEIRKEHHEWLRRTNSSTALEVLTKLTDDRKAVILLRLVHLNMPEMFDGLMKRMQFIEANRLSSSNLELSNHLLLKLSTNIQRALVLDCQSNKRQLIKMLTDEKSYKLVSCSGPEAGRFACWVAFDIFMENAMDGKQFPVTSAIDILTEIISTLKVFNGASWQETFLALWLSALRLVQRERDTLEGPIPHLEARLCILLSIVPLAITRVLDNNSTCYSCSYSEGMLRIYTETGCSHGKGGTDHVSRRQGLISSLQALGQYPTLLCPPSSVFTACNNAVAKAASFVSMTKSVTGGMCEEGYGDTIVKAGGDMRHLIVEACIARKLIDTKAYFWPGYISSPVSLSDQSPVQRSPWSAIMEGASLTGPLVNGLVTMPASSLSEIEKLYHIALNGKEEEKLAAAKILCGATLTRGWNIQEHVVHYVVKLLSEFTESRSQLVDYLPTLSAVLFGASSIDTAHILSMHGMVPEVAAALLPLCEAFGSLVPTSSHKSKAYEESSIYMVFSSAFLFLLRLWKFYRPPLEQCITGRGGAIGSELTLEYLLLLRNSRIQPPNGATQDDGSSSQKTNLPIYIDSYPKLRAWYCQNKSCIASTLSGLSSGSPVHQVANKILNMLYSEISKTRTSSNNSSTPSSNSSSPTTTGEDSCHGPLLPAWEVLEAIPYVLEAILTACAHGRLSSRDLTTGLRDLVDFLPASLAAIISYFSAEITRGIWKSVPMNGTDWPSPAANIEAVDSEIRDILAAAGVSIHSCSSGVCPAILPLPMAALVSLTITFKLDKSLEYIHAVAGPALENCAAACPWPSMPIIGSLWAQKVRRWHNFIVVSCSRSVFRQNQEAVAQLLRSCFTSFLGSPYQSKSSLMSQSGVNGLLGNFILAPSLRPLVAPGFLYLRSCRTIHQVQYVNDIIVALVSEFSCELATKLASNDFPHLKSTRASLAVVTSRAKEVATLGASLLCVAGGVQLVQELYQETVPTWLLSARKVKHGKVNAVTRIVEGYAMAYLLVLAGAFTWGVDAKQPSWALSSRSRLVGAHMDLVAGVLDGNISLGCDPVTWKTYVSCLVGLMVSYTPLWIQEVKYETVMVVANGLRGWQECELAISLLERGGAAAMGSVVELLKMV